MDFIHKKNHDVIEFSFIIQLGHWIVISTILKLGCAKSLINSLLTDGPHENANHLG
jgi:hypothetical protein